MIATGLRSIEGVTCLPAIFSRRGWPDESERHRWPDDPDDLLFELPWRLRRSWDDYETRNKHPYSLLQDIALLLGDQVRHLGWKQHLVQNAEVTKLFLDDPNIKRILLRRDNLLAAYSSELIVRLTGQGRVGIGKDVVHATCTFMADDFEIFCSRRRKVYDRWTALVETAPDRTLQIDYATVKDRGFGSILKFLESGEANYAMPLTAKRNSDDILSRFGNPEEAFAFLRQIGREEWCLERSGLDSSAPHRDALSADHC